MPPFRIRFKYDLNSIVHLIPIININIKISDLIIYLNNQSIIKDSNIFIKSLYNSDGDELYPDFITCDLIVDKDIIYGSNINTNSIKTYLFLLYF